jgi:hypothetical protein
MELYKALRGILAALLLFLLWTTPAQAGPRVDDATLAA